MDWFFSHLRLYPAPTNFLKKNALKPLFNGILMKKDFVQEGFCATTIPLPFQCN